MTGDEELDDRVQQLAQGALAALSPERRAECELMASAGELGMRLRQCVDDPQVVELLYGGAVIALTTWAWLSGDASPVTPGE
jgi:hypothetical protein